MGQEMRDPSGREIDSPIQMANHVYGGSWARDGNYRCTVFEHHYPSFVRFTLVVDDNVDDFSNIHYWPAQQFFGAIISDRVAQGWTIQHYGDTTVIMQPNNSVD